MAYELVMRLGQPFDVLLGPKLVTLPPGGEIRVQFSGLAEATAAYMHLSSHCEIRPVRDEGDGYVNPVVPGEVVQDDAGRERLERLEGYADSGGLMGRTARREVEAKREEEDADNADRPAGD